MRFHELCQKAIEARKNAYCPYSHFAVGAALLADNGKIFTGCNVENEAFGPSICAERVAFTKAVSEGVRSFRAIAIVGGKEEEIPTKMCFPCGTCRQVMSEFCKSDFQIIIYTPRHTEIYTLNSLLPHSFEC